MEAYENTDRQKFLELCTEQMRAKAMRPVIAEELEAHIEDQLEANLAAGMSREEAETDAIRQMGDPVDIGLALDRVHRPKTDWKALGLILLLAAIGVGVQLLMRRETGMEPMFSRFMITTRMGLVILFALAFGPFDYTLMGKYPRATWYLAAAMTLADYMGSDVINGIRRGNWSVMLLVPAFAGLVFSYRKEGIKGICKALGWFAGTFMILLLAGALEDGILAKIWFGGCIFMLAFAVWKGWYGVKRRIGLLIAAIPALLAGLAGVLVYSQGGYQAERIRVFLNPGADPAGYGYLIGLVRRAAGNLKLVGNSLAAMQNQTDLLQDLREDYTFLWISQRYGLAAGIGILVLLVLLTVLLFWQVNQQKNRLGAIMGFGCLYILVTPIFIHVLMNLGLLPPTSCSLPFVSMNGSQNLRLYLSMGILLSIYRGSNICPEPQQASGPARMPRQKTE